MRSFENPWIWIGLIYGAQSVGAALFAWWVKVDMESILPGILLLCTGTLVSFLLASRYRSGKESPWMAAIPVIIYCLFIFSMSHRGHTAQVSFNGNYLHPIEYATVGMFLCWAWRSILVKKGALAFAIVVIASGTVYALTDEFHQSFVPGRDASLTDIGLDMLGLGLSCLFFLKTRRIWLGRQA